MRTPAALLYHAGGLGDFITAIPAIRFWKERRASGRIALLGIPAIAELAKDAGLIDSWLDARGSRFLPLWQEEPGPDAHAVLRSFSEALVFADPESRLLRVIRLSAIPSVFWQPPFPTGKDRHVIDYHLSLFSEISATLPAAARVPTIVPSSDALSAAFAVTSLEPKPVVLHPGSGSALKNWPLDRFGELADRFRDRGIPVLWIRGPAESPFPVMAPDHVIQEPPLPTLGALLSRCRAFIGNDSGVAHLAAAVGCPSVAIFGPSDPALWAPRGERVRIICKSRSCSPCHGKSASVTSCDRSCLTAITVEEVLETAFASGKNIFSRILDPS